MGKGQGREEREWLAWVRGRGGRKESGWCGQGAGEGGKRVAGVGKGQGREEREWLALIILPAEYMKVLPAHLVHLLPPLSLLFPSSFLLHRTLRGHPW